MVIHRSPEYLWAELGEGGDHAMLCGCLAGADLIGQPADSATAAGLTTGVGAQTEAVSFAFVACSGNAVR
jgi:hypothetical protein